MPFQVRGEDGRVIRDETDHDDAYAVARNVHAATGEIVTLVPFRLTEGEWCPDEEQAFTVGAAVEEEPVEEPVEEAPVEKPKKSRKSAKK